MRIYSYLPYSLPSDAVFTTGRGAIFAGDLETGQRELNANLSLAGLTSPLFQPNPNRLAVATIANTDYMCLQLWKIFYTFFQFLEESRTDDLLFWDFLR